MRDRLQSKVTTRLRCLVFVLVLVPLNGMAQTAPAPEKAAGGGADALNFLNGVFARYAQAKTYHLESTEETEISGPFIRDWNKFLRTAIVAPDNRYRFEARGRELWVIEISDGKLEWMYQPDLGEYLQRATPSAGPSRLNPAQAQGAFLFRAAQDTIKSLVAMQDRIVAAEFLPDEDVEVGGKNLACRVIRAEVKQPANINGYVKFSIDKETGVIRKYASHSEGALRPNHPEDRHVSDRKVVFTVAELGGGPLPEQLFAFEPPVQAALVKEFDADPEAVRIHALEGKPFPAIELRAADGKSVSLKSFTGKPVLLDFWATWCAPCVASLPALEKIREEAAEKGLVMISIDEDEDAKAAADLWAKRAVPWPNYHDDGAIVKQLPTHGIPFLVLIDASGNTVFSKEGFYEDELRAALAKMDPAFAPLAPRCEQ
ncbi:MAG: TlpA disulfide reductase family protein [Candidatus Acidiferrales bacterium]